MTPRQRWWLFGSVMAFAILAVVGHGLGQFREAAEQTEREAAKRHVLQVEQALAERAKVAADLLAESLVNPTYFFDLQRIGEVLGGAMRQGNVAYALLLDREGRIIHDGSEDIARFSQFPQDALAWRAGKATQVEALFGEQVVEVAHPILLGDQRLATLRLALKRNPDQALAPLPAPGSVNEGAWLAAVAALCLALLWFGDRRLARPYEHFENHLMHLARRFAGVTEREEAGPTFDRLEQRFLDIERELSSLTQIDALTALPNRIALRQRIGDAINMAQSNCDGELALLFIDLDDFKRINDTLGHDIGDEILAAMARRFNDILRHECPPDQAYMARFGGDEFVMLIEGDQARARAGHIAELLLSTLRIPVTIAEHLLHISASIGITSYPEDGADAARLIKNGDIAMYLAKVQGRNCARYFTNYLTRLAEDRLAIEQDLRLALDHDDLKLHFQPIVDLESGHISGAEALMRWHHPGRGMVPAALFIGVAEDVGLIEAIGDFALRSACETAVRWPHSAGRAPFVSVNVSVKQLRNARFPARVAEVLEETGLKSDLLHLELTESSLLDGESGAIECLDALHAMGVKLWLDDFGTGFSGLNHLRRVPVSGVKIDRSFVADLLTDRHDVALTNAIIAMAQSLDITVVAEGVESAALADLLCQLGCPFGQGYWFGEPAHSEKLVERIIAQRYGDRSQANLLPFS